jgi:hypothetical protein
MSPLYIGYVSYERALKVVVGATIAMLFLGYAAFQARNLIQGPTITLDDTGPNVTNTRAREIRGTARNVVVLRLNGKEVHTDELGAFRHTLTLENGYTVMTIEAEDRYGRKTRVERGFVYHGSV